MTKCNFVLQELSLLISVVILNPNRLTTNRNLRDKSLDTIVHSQKPNKDVIKQNQFSLRSLLLDIKLKDISWLIANQLITDHVESAISQLHRFENQNLLSD